MSPQEFRSLQSNLGSGMQTPLMAVNPATGQMERVYSQMGFGDNGMAADTGYYFASDPNRPADASASFAGGYSTDNGGGGFSDLFKQGIPLTVGLPLALGAGAAAVGAGALGGAAGAEGGLAGVGGAEGLGGAGSTGANALAGTDALGGVEGVGGAGTGLAATGATGTAASGATGVGSGTAAAAGGIGATKLSDIAKGNVGVGDLAAGATVGDLSRILGTGALTLGGMYGANQQAGAYKDLANQYMNLGAPSRARYEASYQPGFTMASDPGYSDALAQTTKETLHQLSPGGNPMGSPNAWEQTLKDVNDKFAFPALQQYRNQNAAGGGLSALTSAAPGAASAGINADANVYNALGAGTADIFNPPKSLSDILRQMKQAGY